MQAMRHEIYQREEMPNMSAVQAMFPDIQSFWEMEG
jgi:hypothetical protein